jgi:hypothetical protein
MTETISMIVQGRVPDGLLRRLNEEVTPEYVKGLLAANGMPTDPETVYNVATSYAHGLPTQDLALTEAVLEDGMSFWGIASGDTNRPERAAVKYLILDHIKDELAKQGIASEINIAGLNPETVGYMEQQGMFRGRLPELRKIAAERGDLEDTLIGAYYAANIFRPLG